MEQDDDPRDSPPGDKPPLLDYPSRPTSPPELDSEPWSEVARASAVVFGFLGLLLFAYFGVCGMLFRGC